MKNEAIPRLRFKGFKNVWNHTTIGQQANIVRGASPRPIKDPKWFDKKSDVGWLRISDVTSQNGRLHFIKQRISKLGEAKTRVLTTPHLILSIAATVGEPAINYVKTGVHDGFLIFNAPKFNLEYMFQWLLQFKPKWRKYGQPGSQVNLNSSIVSSQKIYIPSLQEQQLIGKFFAKLDKLIQLQQKKVSLLKKLKRGYLQKFYPFHRENTLILKVTGYNAEPNLTHIKMNNLPPIRQYEKKAILPSNWEWVRFLSIYRLAEGAQPPHSQFSDKKHLGYIRLFQTRDYGKNPKPVYIPKNKARKISYNGDILLSRYSSGSVFKAKYGAYNVTLLKLTPLNKLIKLDHNFIWYYLQSNYYLSFSTIGKRSAQPGFNRSDLSRLLIPVPPLSEQKAIGKFLSKLDLIIKLHSKVLNHLRKLKKAYLQKMFC